MTRRRLAAAGRALETARQRIAELRPADVQAATTSDLAALVHQLDQFDTGAELRRLCQLDARSTHWKERTT